MLKRAVVVILFLFLSCPAALAIDLHSSIERAARDAAVSTAAEKHRVMPAAYKWAGVGLLANAAVWAVMAPLFEGTDCENTYGRGTCDSLRGVYYGIAAASAVAGGVVLAVGVHKSYWFEVAPQHGGVVLRKRVAF